MLQKKLLRESLLKEVSSHRARARESESYLMASQRNGLEEQRQNLRVGLERLPLSVRRHYIERISDLTRRIDASKKSFPSFRGAYDMM
mgnify:CR=1 FL=1